MKTKILIIEDEMDILELLEYHLQKEGYETRGFLSTDGVEAYIEAQRPSLMIVDRNLPTVEGSEFVRYLYSCGYSIPVIFLTAKDKEKEIEEGFEAGGDDYMTKPFQIKELFLRIKALLKRSGVTEDTKISHRDLLLNINKRELYCEKTLIELTNLDLNLLYTFMRYPNQVLTRDFLREEVWDNNSLSFEESNTIKVAINRLKKKIDPRGDKNYFLSVRGVGYQLI